MNTLETDANIAADGTIQLLSPLPPWLKPGRRLVILAIPEAVARVVSRPVPKVSPESLAVRQEALDRLKAEGGLSSVITDVSAWQRDMRQDTVLPGRE
jgi:hypothetical protein